MTVTEDALRDFSAVGKRPIRHDGVDKVTGKAVYGADVRLPGMVYGKVLRSLHAHAEIKRIDTSKAVAHSEVLAVATSKDLASVSDIVSQHVLGGMNSKPASQLGHCLLNRIRE